MTTYEVKLTHPEGLVRFVDITASDPRMAAEVAIEKAEREERLTGWNQPAVEDVKVKATR